MKVFELTLMWNHIILENISGLILGQGLLNKSPTSAGFGAVVWVTPLAEDLVQMNSIFGFFVDAGF
jgi:hypothetical protein